MNPTPNYSDLGDAWVRQQLDKIRQRHAQLGGHLPMDMSKLLEQAARLARASGRPADA